MKMLQYDVKKNTPSASGIRDDNRSKELRNYFIY